MSINNPPIMKDFFDMKNTGYDLRIKAVAEIT